MIRPDVMQAFVDCFAEAGFKASAFCPSYGLAEATLAVSLMPPGEGIRLELVEENELSGAGTPDQRAPAPLPRDRQLRQARSTAWRSRSAAPTARALPDRGIGKVFVRGASVMHGYFRDEEATAACLSRRRLARHRRHGLSCRAATSSSSAAPRT